MPEIDWKALEDALEAARDVQHIPISQEILEGAFLDHVNANRRFERKESAIEGYIIPLAKSGSALHNAMPSIRALVALAARVPCEKNKPEYGWLLEMDCSQPPQWWGGSNIGWTSNADAARRFISKADAEEFRQHQYLVTHSHATEHGWAAMNDCGECNPCLAALLDKKLGG